MGLYIPGGTEQVIAVQYNASESEVNIVDLFDWIHNTDSSTIYGAVVGGIMKDIRESKGIWIPYKKDDVYIPRKALACDGDWIIKHGDLNFTVMSNEEFRKLYYVVEH